VGTFAFEHPSSLVITLDRVTANVHLHDASLNDLKLHFVPAIRRGFREGNVPMFIQPLIFRISSTALAANVIAIPCNSSHERPPVATPSRVQTEIVQIRDKNAAIRDGLRKVLLALVQMLRQVCDGSSAPVADGATNHADAAPIL
jgi:hypothetical protein